MSENTQALDALYAAVAQLKTLNQGKEVAVIEETPVVVEPEPQELTVPESEGEALQKRTVLLRLKISSFGTKVGVDAAKLAQTEEQKAAARKSIGATKVILKSNRLDKITSLDGEFRRGVLSQALKVGFLKGGLYCIPVTRAPRIEQEIEAYRTKRERLIEDYIDTEYVLNAAGTSLAKDEAKIRLVPLGLYDERDYPTSARLRAGFTVETKFMQLEAPTVLKDVDAGLLARELEKEREFWKDAAYDVKAALRSEMQELLGYLVERLTPGEDGKQKIFRNTLLDNLKEFFETFGDKNIAGDDALAKTVLKARSIVAGVANLDQLRDNEVFRQVVATEISKIKATADTLVEEMPERGIDLTA